MDKKYYIEGYDSNNIQKIDIRCENCDDFYIDIDGVEEIYISEIENGRKYKHQNSSGKFYETKSDGLFAKIVRLVLNSKGYNSFGGTFGYEETRLISQIRNNNVFQVVIIYNSGEEFVINTEYSEHNQYKNDYQYNYFDKGLYYIEIDKQNCRTRKIYTIGEIKSKLWKFITYNKIYRDNISKVYLLGDYAYSSPKNPCGTSSIDLYVELVNKDESITKYPKLRNNLDKLLDKEIKFICDISKLDKNKLDLIFDKTSNEILINRLTKWE